MLTFTFTGVDGSMTESETLTSGMVGKTAQFLFDENWAGLTKTAVFRAGDTSRIVMNISSEVAIPPDVLGQPFVKLYVGVCGTDAAGTLVIPTIMAEGPLIRYGADPIEDETAKELPVWQNLQNQIGEPSLLETAAKDNLVAAVNEVLAGQACIGDAAALKTDAKDTLVAAINEVLAGQACIGDAAALKTDAKDTLVAAVNEVHDELSRLVQNYVEFTPDAAQLLINILSQASYLSDQQENLAALAGALGAVVPEEKEELILHWDFQSGSLVDKVAGLEATVSEDVTLDAAGAHTSSAGSYIMFPLGLDGAPLGENVLEIKFGETAMTDVGTMRLAMISNGSQPASAGLMWNASNCWSNALFDTTEFTDLNLFSGKILTGRSTADGQGIDWYLEEQFLCSASVTTYIPTHVSLGSSSTAAYPYTVEYVKIRPGT